ncbi:MAG: gliding motility-associated C-terminal domain-containing protein [Saprospiraceae bacterium]|nr:gliding motility-associated C-terminal domain-containing protein [Saprospiraceae bacterium]MBK6480675.1 gliding motility-associated C-terminal domain-containing protein [Saprospiraceae bacterium]MBK6816964.1 gliding motility-associated C-terminal domain-containing protein [Saprospiraceae bacterium]MBK7436011.1 gliding motility-associated C-terminal domain-containing protein [Saprospiraceae bacterium]MBK9680320.1 gliding motility-associated C-terminal domain-containing protein [Saprospiraceae
MRVVFKKILISAGLILLCAAAHATHNRAGEITYVQIGPLKIRVTVTTYTKTSSTGADRDSVNVFWGDGQSQYVYRVNGPGAKGEPLQNDIKRNFYVAEHTYPGVGSYEVSMTDPNRVGNILNLNFPNSVGIQFHLATTLTLLNSTIQGYNNSAILLQPPIDFGCIGKKFIHNINAYDPDGDSLAYELVVPFQAKGSEVPNYRFPDQILPGADNKISLDKTTGNFEWLAPQKEGEYNIAILIKEYRNGILLNSIIRDMQITIENCNNDPPILTVPQDICIVAGSRIEFEVSAIDSDTAQKISISALGGPLNVFVNKAVFNVKPGFQSQPATGKFVWQTSCEHISDVPYAIVFRAVDNFKDSTGLADLKSVRIKVVGPPPTNLNSITSGNNKVKLTWEYSNACAVTVNDYFKGFSVWRRVNSNQFNLDTCINGLAGRGYIKIASNVNTKLNNQYTYEDEMVEGGKTHCYRILAEFALTSPGGNSYNRVVSLPSEETCIQLKRDLPFITKVSVNATDQVNGSISVAWILPLADDLDTLMHPGPYKIIVARAEGLPSTSTVYTPIPGAIFSSGSFANFKDTSLVDLKLNTTEKTYSYQLQFFTGSTSTAYGISASCSSVFLQGIGADRIVKLSWKESVPWNNYNYEIYRSSINKPITLIGTTAARSFIDNSVENNQTYCYSIQSIGTYGINGLPTPLTNFSQEVCITPVDSTPPCSPVFTINRDCVLKDNSGSVTNELQWSNRGSDTCFVDDLAFVNIYFSKNKVNPTFIKLASITDRSITTFLHTPDSSYTGCYILTAVDHNNNESKLTGAICPPNCKLEYDLPNSFTPNGDGANDLFTPRVNAGVVRVQFEVFNRWGELLFSTQEPALNWNGRDRNDKEVSPGVYYYVCEVLGFQENASTPLETRKGFIQILR